MGSSEGLFFSLLNWDVHVLIMQQLQPSDLLSLSEASIKASQLVQTYAETRIRPRMLEFLSKRPLTHVELEIKSLLEQKMKNWLEAAAMLVDHSGVDLSSPGVRQLRREHVYNADEFSWLDTPKYIEWKHNEALGRDIVKLHLVWFLYFRKAFVDVQPGKHFYLRQSRRSRRASLCFFCFFLNSLWGTIRLFWTAVQAESDNQ